MARNLRADMSQHQFSRFKGIKARMTGVDTNDEVIAELMDCWESNCEDEEDK